MNHCEIKINNNFFLLNNFRGICFIETSSLDGEKNYKNKEAITSTLKWVHPEKNKVVRLVGTINCIEPNENLG